MAIRRGKKNLRDTHSIIRELKKIEAEERAIKAEEKVIEQRQSVLRTLEELGLMRWKSYYVLTAGAILLLALTFVASLWVMNDQMVTAQETIEDVRGAVYEVEIKIDALRAQIDDLEAAIRTIDLGYYTITDTSLEAVEAPTAEI